jgi:hypothetical protein
MEEKEIYRNGWLLCFVALVFIILSSTTAFGAVIRVPGDYSTIQGGIDAASNGDTVSVADGTYVGLGNKDLDFNGKAITVKSDNGPENCVIDCEGNGRGFYFHSDETQSSVLNGFTIINGQADYGGGIKCNESPRIINCKIIGNTAEKSGGGLFCAVWEANITNCIIADNTAVWGGGIYLSYAQAKITNCTIFGNTATIRGGGIYVSKCVPTITNCILWCDSPHEVFVLVNGNPIPNVSYCDIQDSSVTGPTIIHSDPLFVDVSDPSSFKWDLHLLPSSPCIDMGSNAAPGLPSTDFEGDPRIIDGDNDGTATVDMGADEYGIDHLVANFSATPTTGAAPLTVNFTDLSTGTVDSWNWSFGDSSNSNEQNPSQNPSHTYNDTGSYTVTFTVTGTEDSDTETKTDYIKVRYPPEAKAIPWILLLLLDD